jgi:hypothetical protein
MEGGAPASYRQVEGNATAEDRSVTAELSGTRSTAVEEQETVARAARQRSPARWSGRRFVFMGVKL